VLFVVSVTLRVDDDDNEEDDDDDDEEEDDDEAFETAAITVSACLCISLSFATWRQPRQQLSVDSGFWPQQTRE